MKKFIYSLACWVLSFFATPKKESAESRPSLIDLEYFSRMTGIHHLTLIELVLQHWGCSENQLEWVTVTPDNMHYYIEACDQISRPLIRDSAHKAVYETIVEKHMLAGRPCTLLAIKTTMLELYPNESVD